MYSYILYYKFYHMICISQDLATGTSKAKEMEHLSVPAASDSPSRKSSSAIARSRSGSIVSAVSSAESTAAVERCIAQQAALHAYASQTNTS